MREEDSEIDKRSKKKKKEVVKIMCVDVQELATFVRLNVERKRLKNPGIRIEKILNEGLKKEF